jgi:outer membrane protein assembly factor BamA
VCVHAQQPLDLIDVVKSVGKGSIIRRTDSGGTRKTRISVMPAAGYTLQTGLGALLSGNASFYTSKTANQSVIASSIAYTEYHQTIFPILSDIWTSGNKYHFSTDWRYLKYPSITYGLGSRSDIDAGYTLDYSAIRLHQTLTRRISGHFYAGVGWDFDYFWNIREVDTPAGVSTTSFERYTGGHTTEQANGPVLAALYDSRDNPINASTGWLLKADLHLHPEWAGNTNNWNAFIIDARKYMRFPASSNNVLAFWTYDWFTKRGRPPYLMLPNTGGDPSSNTGRGYIQGRYRGNNFIYLESEYRLQLTRNGLFGAVIFANAQSVTRDGIRNVDIIAPGYGAGLRVKLNKFNNTNLAIDYGFGLDGSQGLFINLGEVF